MKDCEVFRKGLCLGCTGLAEQMWCGPEQCEIYKKYKNINGLDLCKQILKGESNVR